MKIQTLASLMAASAVASASNAATTIHSNYTNWAAAAAGVITSAGSGAVYGSDWSGSYQPSGNPTVTFGGGWQTMQVQSLQSGGTGPSGGGNVVTVSGNSSGMQSVTFTFLANSYGAPYGPVSPNGFYAFGIHFSATGTNASALFSMQVNGTTITTPVAFADPSGGFVGVVVDWGGTRINTVTFNLNVDQGMTITGASFASVPAPGAMALLGVAGLVGSRRRR